MPAPRRTLQRLNMGAPPGWEVVQHLFKRHQVGRYASQRRKDAPRYQLADLVPDGRE
jgi:hypothetical protein